MISIISSVYNCSEDIPYFVRNSVDNSTLCERHYIVNDGSVDATDEVACRHMRGIKHINYDNSIDNLGLFQRKQELSKYAQGNYVIGLSHDDFIVPGYLEKVERVLSVHPDVGLVYCNKAIIDEFGNYKTIDRPEVCVANRALKPNEFIDYFILPNWEYHSLDAGAVMNVDLAAKVYSDFVVDRLGAFSDAFFIWMIALISRSYHINEVGHVLKQHPETWSQSSDIIQKQLLAKPLVECILHYHDNGMLSRNFTRRLIKRYVPLMKSGSDGRVY